MEISYIYSKKSPTSIKIYKDKILRKLSKQINCFCYEELISNGYENKDIKKRFGGFNRIPSLIFKFDNGEVEIYYKNDGIERILDELFDSSTSILFNSGTVPSDLKEDQHRAYTQTIINDEEDTDGFSHVKSLIARLPRGDKGIIKSLDPNEKY